MTKDRFIGLVELILKHHEHEVALDRALKPFGFGFSCSDEDSLEEALVSLMEETLKDGDEWLRYFLYERFGDLSEACVRDQEGETVDTSDWGRVFDLITAEKA